MANFSLAALTVLELAPPEMIELAARCGYDNVGLRLLPATPGGVSYRLMDDAPLLRETLRRLQSTGVTVADLEVVAFRPDTDVASFTPFFEAGARLGAKHILVAAYDPDLARFLDRYRQFCEAAATCGLTSDLEFMPWTSVPDLNTAMRIVADVDHSAAGILVDALHFDHRKACLRISAPSQRSGFTTGNSATVLPNARRRRSSSSMPHVRSGCFRARAA